MTLHDISKSIDERFRQKFIEKTLTLLNEKVNASYRFLDGSLNFEDGKVIWKQNLPRLIKKPLKFSMKIMVASPEQAYALFKAYFQRCWSEKGKAYDKGILDLEQYCND